MVTGATSLGLVRDELFATMEEAEQSLEHFIIDRNNGGLLQQAVENLKQVRGTLNLIELTGAELLAQEILQLATDIPVGAGEDRDVQLAALSNALYVLRRYLESVDASEFVGGFEVNGISKLVNDSVRRKRDSINAGALVGLTSRRVQEQKPKFGSTRRGHRGER